MATYQALSELKQRAETALQKLGGGQPAGGPIDPTMQAIGKARKMISEYGHDPNFDEGGLKSLRFRASFSVLDSDSERKWWLSKAVGKTGWTQDRYGRYAITPEGMVNLGYASGERPVLIDEPGPTLYDFADFAGDIPPILGSVGLALYATGAGAPVGVAAAMVGAGLGKALQEIGEQYAGQNIQSPIDVAGDVGMTALTAGAGEGIYRGGRAVMRKLIAPERQRMTFEMRGLVKQAKSIGVKPSVEQITKAPIVGRIYSMMNAVLGNPLIRRNEFALTRELDRLRQGVGASGRPDMVGAAIKADISNSRAAVARWSASVSTKIEQTWMAKYGAGSNQPPAPPIPTARLKQMATEIESGLPRSAEGDVVLTPPELVNGLQQIQSLPDNITVAEAQKITERLYDAIGEETIVPGIFRRDARLLWKAASGMYEDISDPTLRGMMLQFRAQYKQKMTNFNHAYITRLMKRSDTAGFVEPEQVVDTFFKKGGYTKLKQIKAVVTPETWLKARRYAMEEIFSAYERVGADPINMILDGKGLTTALNAYSRPTLTAMFGPQKVADLYRLARVTQLAQFKLGMSGGIVAANIALHPLRNLPRLVQLNILAKIMNSEAGIRWLTEGISMPRTRKTADTLGRLGVYVQMMARDAMRGPVENDIVRFPEKSLPPRPAPQGSPMPAGSAPPVQSMPLQ